MILAIWRGCMVVGELEISDDGKNATWMPHPSKPNNGPRPDQEIDPFAKYIQVAGRDVEEYGQ